jgi:hypothetical protein
MREDSTNGNGVATTSLFCVTGMFLAHTTMALVPKAFLGAKIIRGEYRLVDLTVTQVSGLLKVNQAYLHAALRKTPHEEALITAGVLPLIGPVVKRLPPPAPASPQERLVQAAAELGGISSALDVLAKLETAA